MNDDVSKDRYYMLKALKLAMDAGDADEVPVGAVIVREDQVIGSSSNQSQLLKDPTAHAEILAITQAAAAVGDWRLSECTLYVTKEPCVMCAGAVVQSRMARVVWGAGDPRRGGESVFGILNSAALNHRPKITAGVMESEARDLLTSFFQGHRD